jgi:hypothetical protein
MPKYIFKVGENEYLEWSTIVDAPVSYIYTREGMARYLSQRAGYSGYPTSGNPEQDLRDIEQRLVRADTQGTSDMTVDGPQSLDDLMGYNRAGPNEACLTPQEVIEAVRAWREKGE